jgi:predicted AlkP superfamily pyrophosphatase or phosphodiesterase
MRRLILVLVDGLGFDTAAQQMGFLEGAVAAGQARRWRLHCALPSLSRPLYETIHTGLAPMDHGILSNETVRPSSAEHLFGRVRAAGGRTAAAAYAWFSELYDGVPYDPVMGREVDDPARVIQHGRFYTEDDTPDREVIRTGAMLAGRFSPDYLLIHPMGCDWVGHGYGADSPAYRRQAAMMDDLLAQYAPRWLAQGYTVAVTADHGMDADGRHGGTRPEVCSVPFYLLGGPGGPPSAEASQLSVAPTLLALMGLPPAPAMTAAALVDLVRAE